MKRINEVFKPTKITLAGKSKILLTENGKFVVKPKQKDIKKLYDYLACRQFNNFPKLIDEYDENYIYDYIEEIPVPLNQKAADMASLLALLHNKTAYFKPITADHVKAIYENVLNNILYLEKHYELLFNGISTEVLMSPASYLLIRNRSKIMANLSFLKNELELWLKKMTDHPKERVVYCHNNLSIDHFLKTTEEYFVSWDNYTIDTPILDLINLYRNDYYKYDFSNFWEIYNERFPLSEEEKQLFFIMIALPYELEFTTDEYTNTQVVNNLLTYLYKTENLIRFNYAPQDKKEESYL